MKKPILLPLIMIFVLSTKMINAQWQPTGLAGQSIYALASDGTNIFAGVFNSGAYLSTNNGSNWNPVNTGLPTFNFNRYIASFAISGTNVFLGTAGSSGSGVYLSTNNGTNWTAVNTGLTNLKVIALAISGTNVFAGTNGGGVFLSTNNGTNWTAVNTGLTNATVGSLAISGTNIFAGTTAGVFLSTNDGTNWSEVNTGLTTLNTYSLAVSGSNIFTGTNGGGVFLSTNNGTNWTSVNTGLTNLQVNSLAISGTNIFAGTNGGGVFLSTNNGTNWTAVNTGLTGLNVTKLAISGTYIFTGIDLGGAWKQPLANFVGQEDYEATYLTVAPNPFSSSTTLRTDKIFEDATLTVYNTFGQQVKHIKNISGQTIILQRDHLPSGQYYLQLIQDNKIFSLEKLLITDN